MRYLAIVGIQLTNKGEFMERVSIATVKIDQVMVHDIRDGGYIQQYRMEDSAVVENNPMLVVDPYNEMVEIQNLKIREFRNNINGHETRKLIAIHPDVYEELYSISRDEVDEVLRDHKATLKSKDLDISYLNRSVSDARSTIRTLESASFLTRLKWLFTGVKY